MKLLSKNPEFLNSKLWRWVIVPLIIYFFFFCLFTWPWISNFSAQYMTGGGDGLQNVWNIWWVDKAVTELHQSPWHTQFLHFPYGVTLIGQTLNPFNGFVAIFLLPFMSLVQAFNVMIIFSFVVGGLTAFWLAYEFSKSYIGSLFGGFLFTFSSYHFAHAIGHMQLVSLQWIPLFLLLWWRFIKKPSYKLAIGAAIALLLVILCDYYYFLYSLIMALIMLGYLWRSGELPDLKKPQNYRPLGLFVLASLIIVAPLPIALLIQNSKEELLGSHPARTFSTDLFAPFINGGFWRFHVLTDGYWRHISAFISESSVYLTLTALTLFVISWIKRRTLGPYLGLWQGSALFFGIMSLGPRLNVRGNTIESIPMPYTIMEKVIPGMKLSGVPVRMMVMVSLSMAVIIALVLAKLDVKSKKHRLILGLILLLFVIELWPAKLPTFSPQMPKYVAQLQQLPPGAVYENAAATESEQLLYQTTHEKPIAFGYISRKPKSLDDKEQIMLAYNAEGKHDRLCKEFQIRYYTTSVGRPLTGNFPILYQDHQSIIYDLKNSAEC